MGFYSERKAGSDKLTLLDLNFDCNPKQLARSMGIYGDLLSASDRVLLDR